MPMHRLASFAIAVPLLSCPLLSTRALGQTAARPPEVGSPSAAVRQRIAQLVDPGTGAWTVEQWNTMGRLRDAALADDYALTRLRHLTANIGPRLAGSAQAAQAVEYVAAEMRALGASVTLEKTRIPVWVRGAETGELVEWTGMTPNTTQKLVLTALGGSGATPAAGITAPVVVVRSFDEFRLLPAGAVKGRILLFNHGFDKELAAQGGRAYGPAVVYRSSGPAVGAAAGALAVLVRSVGGADFRLPHTGMTNFDPAGAKIPAAAVTAEDADLLADLAAQGPVRLHLTLTPQSLPDADSYNVIADWKGAVSPEEVVIVSGHLDSWDLGTGAIDDGAGVVVSMQVIQLMQKLGLHPRRTIRFVAWMDEEAGGVGGQSYAKDHAADFKNFVGVLESDLGCDHPAGLTFAGTPELGEWLRPVARALEPIGAAALTRGAEAGTDVEPEVDAGIPGFSPTQDSRFYFNYHHSAADTFDKVDPRHLAENAAVMAVTAYALADSAMPAPRGTPVH